MFLEQTETKKDQWLKERQHHIGGSDIAVLLGLLAHLKTPYQLWLEKTGRDTSVVDNANTRRGLILEPAVAKYFTTETGIELSLNSPDFPAHFIHPVHEFMSVTPDGIIMTDKGVYEAKTTKMTIDPDPSNMPRYWFCQLIWGAGILRSLGIVTGDENYIAFLARMDFGHFPVSFEPSFFQYLMDQAGEFWTKYVQTDTPPPPVNAEDVLRQFPKHITGKTIEATPELIEQLAYLKSYNDSLRVAKGLKEETEEKIKMIMQDSEAILINGSPAATWKSSKERECFDLESFKAAHPDLAAKFTKSEPGRRSFLLKNF